MTQDFSSAITGVDSVNSQRTDSVRRPGDIVTVVRSSASLRLDERLAHSLSEGLTRVPPVL